MSKNLSYSRVQKYNTCPRQYDLTYQGEHTEDLDVDTDRLDLGSLVHYGLEQALKSNDPNPVALATKAVTTKYNDDPTLYAPDVVSTAVDMLETYIPMLGINTSLKPFKINGAPAIEHWFTVPIDVNTNRYTFRGLIDAILVNSKGEVLLVDWKTRGNTVDADSVILDAQLYIYTYIAINYLDIPVTRAVQVQLNTNTPAIVTLTQKNQPSKRMRKTTKELFDSSMAALGLDPSQYYDDFADKIVDRNEFISIVRVDTSPVMINEMWQRFLQSAYALDTDDMFRPVHSSSVCKYCNFKTACFRSIDTDTKLW